MGKGELYIIDWLVHGGHQYEFFKTGPRFYCTLPNGFVPKVKDFGRPIDKNGKVYLAHEFNARKRKYDIMMVRAGINYAYVDRKYNHGPHPPGIAVMQTYKPFKIPDWVRCVVWNSKDVMMKHKGSLSKLKHFYIPHGFDPKEFNFLDLKRNGRVLTASSLFKQRAGVLGFHDWLWVSENMGKCNLLGHGNNRIKGSIGSWPLKRLVREYNRHSVYFNPTARSAMPRARAEALMCGTPLVTTNNFGIDNYLIDGKSCIFANKRNDMLKALKRVLGSSGLREELSGAGREAAIKHFHIRDYIERWKHVFRETI